LQPDEHKYAVYAPLFAPISVPVIVAIIKEVKRWRKKRKARRTQGVEVNKDKLVVSRPEKTI
jgi:phosphatidylinositol glycan class S